MKKLIIDVREEHEYKSGHYEGAINIPLSKFQDKSFISKEIPTEVESIVYCRSGGRSSVAKQFLESYGYKNVKNGINQQYLEENIDNI